MFRAKLFDADFVVLANVVDVEAGVLLKDVEGILEVLAVIFVLKVATIVAVVELLVLGTVAFEEFNTAVEFWEITEIEVVKTDGSVTSVDKFWEEIGLANC